MIIQIDTQKVKDPNEFGELLRNYCFDDTPCMTMTGFHKPYGCYSTFELNHDLRFIKLSENNPIYKKLARLSGYINSDKKIEFYVYSNNHIDLGWWWDGDGTLIIQEKNKIAINTDCKCDYTWEWLDETNSN